jgi:hypothetical protein
MFLFILLFELYYYVRSEAIGSIESSGSILEALLSMIELIIGKLLMINNNKYNIERDIVELHLRLRRIR